MVYMEYKNIQSLASGETKDIIIHIGPILHIVERNPCTENTTWIYPSPRQRFKRGEIKPSTVQEKHSEDTQTAFNHPLDCHLSITNWAVASTGGLHLIGRHGRGGGA